MNFFTGHCMLSNFPDRENTIRTGTDALKTFWDTGDTITFQCRPPAVGSGGIYRCEGDGDFTLLSGSRCSTGGTLKKSLANFLGNECRAYGPL